MNYAVRIDKDPRIKSRLIDKTTRQFKRALQDQNQDKLAGIFGSSLNNQNESKINNSFYYPNCNFLKNKIIRKDMINMSHRNSKGNSIILRAIKNNFSEIPGFYSRKTLMFLKRSTFEMAPVTIARE
jgi:hypothetical protein